MFWTSFSCPNIFSSFQLLQNSIFIQTIKKKIHFLHNVVFIYHYHSLKSCPPMDFIQFQQKIELMRLVVYRKPHCLVFGFLSDHFVAISKTETSLPDSALGSKIQLVHSITYFTNSLYVV